MARKEISVSTWIAKFMLGKYDAPDIKTQIAAGWYDWFCGDRALAGKTKRLGKKVVQIARSKKIDTEKMYVWFKNNCPGAGTLYDDFRFADMKTGDVMYTIIPSSGHDSERGKASVWGRENDFQGPLVEGTWDDVLKFFGV